MNIFIPSDIYVYKVLKTGVTPSSPSPFLTKFKQKDQFLQIVSTSNSSATFWKSCTTFGRRNYLLRFPQIFKNQCDLTGCEHMLGGTIVRFAECFGELLVGPDPDGQAVEGSSCTNVRSIGLCQLALVIGADFHEL